MDKVFDDRHDGPFDRGMADAHYRRKFDPHYYIANTMTSERVGQDGMTADEIEAYTAGFNEGCDGDKKSWG